jgi:phosphatidylglycerol:prolipoprotein diacylglycerol transferase
MAGLWLGLTLAEKYSHRYGINPNLIYRIVIAALIAAAIGARLVYFIRFFPTFINSPASILSLNPDLLDLHGALLGITLIVVYFIRRYKPNPWTLLDSMAPILTVLAIASSMANLASGNGYGSPTSLPWAIYLWGDWRHPSQVYEMLISSLVLVIFWPGNRLAARFVIPGMYGMSLIAVTASSRLYLEAYRGDSTIISAGFRSTQLIAWLILALMLLGISKRISQSTHIE